MIFYPGLHHPGDARHFERACVSVKRLARRKKPIECPDVLLDSGAFSELALHGKYRASPAEYASTIRRLHDGGIVNIIAAVSQDYMCEPVMLAKTGLTIDEHQRLTIERYDALLAESLPVPIMPVLQGYHPEDYRRHVRSYGDRLTPGMWVGVGSVCKRNSSPGAIIDVLGAIHRGRADMRLHGFGLKLTSLADATVRRALYSADSMAWSFAARREGRNANDWREAKAFERRVNHQTIAAQTSLSLFGAGVGTVSVERVP